MNNLKKKKKGFTLIELIIVLAVMAIIALIAIPNFTAVRNNSKVKADNQSCEVIERAVLMLVADETVATPAKNTSATYTVTVSGKGNSKNVSVKDSAQKANSAIEEALQEVNAPQESGKTNYVVTIDSNGKVTAETAPKTTSETAGGTGQGTGGQED